MTRRLAVDRCRGGGHVLAEVLLTPEGEPYVHVRRVAEPTVRDGRITRDQRQTHPLDVPFDRVQGGIFGVLATCGCGDNHALNLVEIKRRALAGDTRERIIAPVQRSSPSL